MELLQKILSKLLRQTADDIDQGKYDCSEEEISQAINTLSNFNSDMPLGKEAACYYLGLSRSTFDTYVREGKIPLGLKHRGLKEKTWKRSDLERVKI